MTKRLSIIVGSCAIAFAIVAGILESALAIKHRASTEGLTTADCVQIVARGSSLPSA